MNKKRGLVTLISTVLLFFVLGATSHAVDMIKWTGCGITKKAFMVEAATAYKEKTGIIISTSGGGATKGIRDTNAGISDMGGSCRSTLPDKFPDEEADAYMTLVAWDALVPIVHKSNPINGLTDQQLKDILLGKTVNWKEVGGPDKKILVVARVGKISGVGYETRKIIFGDANIDYAKDALLLKSSGPVENKVQIDPIAIGVTGISSAQKRVKQGKNLKILKVNGQEASVANIGSGAYPTFRPLFIISKGKPTGEVKGFLDWLLSEEGQKLVEAAGTVSLKQGAGLKDKFKYWEHTDRIVNFDSLP